MEKYAMNYALTLDQFEASQEREERQFCAVCPCDKEIFPHLHGHEIYKIKGIGNVCSSCWFKEFESKEAV